MTDKLENFLTRMTSVLTTAKLHSIIAAMWVEYNQDETCDYKHINQLIEDASALVAQEIGGFKALGILGEAHVDNPMWARLKGPSKKQNKDK